MIDCIVICVVMVAMWLFGCISENTIYYWYAFAIVGNSLSAVAIWILRRLWPMWVLIFADFLFYIIIELDATCSISPWLLYGTLFGICITGLMLHWIKYRTHKGQLIAIAISDLALNASFLALDLTLMDI